MSRVFHPEPWGAVLSDPLTEAQMQAFKERLMVTVGSIGWVGVEVLRLQHFPEMAPFVQSAVDELIMDGRLRKNEEKWQVRHASLAPFARLQL